MFSVSFYKSFCGRVLSVYTRCILLYMAKVTAPLLSLSASGTLAKSLNYCTTGFTATVRRVRGRAKPVDPRTPEQQSNRDFFTRSVSTWQFLTGGLKDIFSSAASSEKMSGFNLYIVECRKERPSALGMTVFGFSSFGDLTRF